MPNPGTAKNRSLNYGETYACPVCRQGQLAALTLMDAYACPFCRHIFTANLQAQSIQLADGIQPLVWRWTGQNWQALHQGSANLTWLVWLLGGILVVVPPSLVGLAAYIFPNSETDPWNFPLLWTGLTFFIHFVLVSWLVAEHHQFPLYVALKIRVRELLASD
ncbi:MAG: DUF2396 family protein [Leptolyngbyaceae cyanobacterium bins.59]|nr:DUF2396 family protein [Leptolyngbyaceae cyanobacterium bins.59]